MLGEPWYQVGSGDTIEMHPTWTATYLPAGRVAAELGDPDPGALQQRGESARSAPRSTRSRQPGWRGAIDVANTNTYGGCFNPRYNRISGFLVAPRLRRWRLDMNTTSNCQGCVPHMNCDVVRIFRKHGFAWGGNFRTPDGMHFEWVGERARPDRLSVDATARTPSAARRSRNGRTAPAPRRDRPRRAVRQTRSTRRSRATGTPERPSALRRSLDRVTIRFVIIGGGPAGNTAATYAARLGAEVTVIERDVIGGAAHLWDCIPSKTMIATGGAMSFSRRIDGHGPRAGRAPRSTSSALTRAHRGHQGPPAEHGVTDLLESQGVRMIQRHGPLHRPARGRGRRRRRRRGRSTSDAVLDRHRLAGRASPTGASPTATAS